MNPQQQLTCFLADIRQKNRRINIDKTSGTRTSIGGLIAHLQATQHHPAPLTVLQAVQHCANPNDQRIRKYLPAIQRLVSVWGTHDDYPSVTDGRADRASANFYQQVRRLAVGDRCEYEDVLRYSENAAGFGVEVANPGYVARVNNPNGGQLDITSRGLVLRSGLVPESNGFNDRSYTTRLQLGVADLEGMAHRSIADVGCGAAVFRAEMESLYGCATTGLDLNHALVPHANATVRRRYARSMLYLKMLVDTDRLSVTLTPLAMATLINRLATSIPDTLDAYVNNPPVAGNIFNLGAAMNAHNGGQAWDYVVTMYLLCYFTPQQQTDAVLSMCAVSNRGVFIYNGSGAGAGITTQHLTYDQEAVRQSFPGCRIEVKDAATHHILF